MHPKHRLSPLCLLLTAATLASCGADGDADELSEVDERAAVPLPTLGVTLDVSPDAVVVPALTAGEMEQLRAEPSLAGAMVPTDAVGTGLYYATIEVTAPHQLDALRSIGVPYDFFPLFEEELEALTGDAVDSIAMQAAADEAGAFVFALLSGATYNELKAHAEVGEQVFERVTLRDVPDAAAASGTMGSQVALPYLAARQIALAPGLIGEALPETPAAPTDPVVAAIAAIAAEPTAELQAAIVDQASGLLFNRVDVTVSLQLRENDSVFVDASGEPRPITRGWGRQAGIQVPLTGMKVIADGGAAQTSARIEGLSNHVTISVPKHANRRICLKLKTPQARITADSHRAAQVCSPHYVFDDDTTLSLQARHPWVSALARATDGGQFLEEMVELANVRRAEVAVGSLANRLSDSNQTPWAPCASMHAADEVIAAFAGLIVDPLLSLIFYTQANVDLVIPDAWASSPGLMLHEYGHFATCNLLHHKIGPGSMTNVWALGVGVQTLGDRGIEDEAAVIAETLADAFASQVVGGTNYTQLPGGADPPAPLQSFTGPFARYCNAASDACLDPNELIPNLFVQHPEKNFTLFVATVGGLVGLIHDALDGHPVLTPELNASGNGGVWSLVDNRDPTAGLRPGAFRSPHQHDEVVRLTPEAFDDVIARWAELQVPGPYQLTFESFFTAWSDVMRDAGFNESQVCRVFSLHVSPSCPGEPCQCVAPDVDLGFNPDTVALDQGDLVAPLSLYCESVNDQTLRCRWEDLSIGADGYQVDVTEKTSSNLLLTRIIDESAYDTLMDRVLTPIPPGEDEIRVTVRSTKDDRLSAPIVRVFPHPGAPPPTFPPDPSDPKDCDDDFGGQLCVPEPL